MSPEEAKAILVRYRINNANDTDPEFVEALQVALANSELSRWLREQQEFHAGVQQEFRAIPVPAGLKNKILAERPALSLPPRSSWSRREFLALAASLILLAGGTTFWLQRTGDEQSFANFRTRMVAFALRTYQMDIVTTDGKAVRQHLASRGGPADFPLTPGLAKMPVKGGGRLSWQNHPVSMMCFSLTNNGTLYMFVMEEQAIDGAKPAAKAVISAEKRLATAAWNSDGKLFLIAADTDARTLAAFIP